MIIWIIFKDNIWATVEILEESSPISFIPTSWVSICEFYITCFPCSNSWVLIWCTGPVMLPRVLGLPCLGLHKMRFAPCQWLWATAELQLFLVLWPSSADMLHILISGMNNDHLVPQMQMARLLLSYLLLQALHGQNLKRGTAVVAKLVKKFQCSWPEQSLVLFCTKYTIPLGSVLSCVSR